MKKIFSVILSGILIFSLAGCGSGEKQSSKGEQSSDNFDMKIAQNVIDVYMKYLMKEDQVNAKKLYSKELSSKNKSTSINDLKVTGYNIEDTNEIGRTGVFKLKVARSNVNKPSAVLDEYTVKVKKEGNDYKIDDVNSMADKESYIQENELRLRSKDNVKTNLIIDADGIPEYVFSKDDKANVNKMTVPKKNFGIINFSYGGNKLAICTYDKDSYIGIVKIDESMAVQGGAQAENQGGNQGGASQQKGSSNVNVKEPPIGKEIVSVDLLKDSQIEKIVFSIDEKFLLAQYDVSSNSKNIRIYYTESGNIIPFKFEEIYSPDLYNVTFSSFDKGTLNYEVSERSNDSKVNKNLIGKWQLDLEKFKQKKI